MKIVTVREIVAAIGCTAKTVSVRLRGVRAIKVSGENGRSVNGYHVSELPEEWKTKFSGAPSQETIGCEKNTTPVGGYSDDQLAVAVARSTIVKAAYAYCSRMGYDGKRGSRGSKKGEVEFLMMLAGGHIEGTAEALKTLGNVPSWSTLNRWAKGHSKDGISGLVRRYVSPKRGQTKLTEEQQGKLISVLIQRPHASIENLRCGLQGACGTLDVPSSKVISNYITRWKRENKEAWEHCLNPSAWKNKMMFSAGNAAGGVDRLYQLVEGDSSPTDIRLNVNGKLVRYSLIALIDIYSRQAQLVVSPSSTGDAIVSALRKWIDTKGVMERLRIDNGKDWISNRVSAVLNDLEIDTTLCGKFKSEEKGTVERFFRTFSHGLLELCPHFIGHNVSERQAIRERQTFAERIMKTGGEPIDIAATPSEFQSFCDRWVENVYCNNIHSSLKCSPADMVRNWRYPVRRVTDKRTLDNLLLPAVNRGGMRKIGKKGIKVDSGANYPYYAADEFVGHSGEDVYVYVDPLDMGRVVCYLSAADGCRKYLCEAVNLEWAGIDRAEFASRLKHVQARHIKEQKRELNKVARSVAMREVVETYMQLREGERGTVIDMPKRSVEHVTTATVEAAKVSAPPVDNDDMQKPKRTNIKLLLSDPEYYDQLRNALKTRGGKLTDREAAWLKGFYKSIQGRSALTLHGDLRGKYGVAESIAVNG